jgi:hypothetical protein
MDELDLRPNIVKMAPDAFGAKAYCVRDGYGASKAISAGSHSEN